MDIDTLLTSLVEQEGSDLHLKVGTPPIMRKFGKLFVLNAKWPVLNHQALNQLISPLVNSTHKDTLNEVGSVDIGYGLKGLGRFRFNIFFQRGSLRVVVRHIPHKIPTTADLNLPDKYLEVMDQTERGLILVVGATGSGKSTTLAALIDHINHTKCKHILTIEDPIEFLIKDHHSLITQREIEVDCKNAVTALKASLRQDPDIILFSELRSKESIFTALMAAETGHLVFSTLHTHDASETINRIAGAFSKEEQLTIRPILASTLKAVFAQRLIPKRDNDNHVPAVEILLNTARIQKAIEKQASPQKIRLIMQESHDSWGMQTFDYSIAKLAKKNLISKEDACRYASSPNNLKMILEGIAVDDQLGQQKSAARAIEKNTNIQTLHIQGTTAKTYAGAQKKRLGA